MQSSAREADMADPLVSVIVPVRDEALFLEEALLSLAEQTFEDFEVIVVDDGSRDASPEIATEFAASDQRFRLIRQGRRGVVAAAERARTAARGRYVACMDGDDRAHPRRLEVQLDALESEDLVACGGGVSYFSEDGVLAGLRRYADWLNSLTTPELAARDVFVESPISNPTLFARRDVLDSVGGYRETPWPEDYDLVLRLWSAGGRFRNLDTVVHAWRDHPNRLSRTSPRYSIEAFARCKVHHLRRTLLRRGEQAVVWGAGPVGKMFARELLDANVEVVEFVDVDPRKIGQTIYDIPVRSAEEGTRRRAVVAIGAVAGPAARGQLRALAGEQGRVEGVDFIAVA
jgi:glycosyltransferase involved in cell wall biosynthesis